MQKLPTDPSLDINQRLEDLENYVLTLERKIMKLNSADRVIVEDVHCFIRFLQNVCKCCVMIES